MMKNKISKEDLLSFIGVFLITIGDYFCYSWIDIPYRHIIGVPFIVAGSIVFLIDIYKNIKNKLYTKKQLKIIGVLLVLGALVWHRINVFYTTIVMALYFVNKDLKKMFKYLFISMAIGMGLIIFLNIINVIPDFISYRKVDGVKHYRYSLGFRNPNVLYRFYIAFIMCGAIVTKNNRLYLMLSLIAGMILYLITDSRMGLVILLLFIALCMLPKKIRKKTSFNRLVPYAFIGGIIISIAVALLFYKGVVNDVLSFRPEIWKLYLGELGFFGRFGRIKGAYIENDIEVIKGIPLDNLYLHTLCYGGIYGCIFYIVLFFVAFHKVKEKNNYNMFMIFFISLAYGFIENFSGQNEGLMLLVLLIMLLDKNKMKELNDDYVYEKSSN